MKMKYVTIILFLLLSAFPLLSQDNSVNELRQKRKAALEAINEAQSQLAEAQKKIEKFVE